MLPLISVVVVSYNSRRDLPACLDALLAVAEPRLDIIVVDNASTDGSADLVATAFPMLRLLRSPRNLGFAGGNNLGFAAASGDILLTLNPDARLEAAAWSALAGAFAGDPRLGIAGCKLCYADGRIQHAGGVLDYPLATAHHRGAGEADRGQYDEPADVEFVTGAALAMRRAVYEATCGFDERFFPAYYEDADLCYRARAAGWRVAYLPQAAGVHASFATLDARSETYFRHFHGGRLRFVARHYTTEQLIADFLPAEAARLRHEMPAADRRASEDTYRRLWRESMPDTDISPVIERTAELERLLGELEGRAQVQERPFTSRAPLVGGLIVRLREAWNSVATKWYVRPLFEQQVQYNRTAAQAINEVAHEAGVLETPAIAYAAVLGRRLQVIEEQTEARLKAIEGRVEALEGRSTR